MRYTIEGFSQAEAVKFRRTEVVKDSKGNDREKVVTLDCTDLVILRWLVDFWPGMMKVEIGGKQYAWLSYKHAIEDMPLLGIKKGMFALRLKKLVDFGILTHKTVKSGGTFSYYGFGPAYMRLADTDHVQDVEEGVSNILDTPAQNISDQINQSIKDPSTKDVYMGKPKKKKAFDPPTREEIKEYVREKGYHFSNTVVHNEVNNEPQRNRTIRKFNRMRLDDFREVCAENDMQILFIEIPTLTSWSEAKSKAITKYTDKYGINYIDLNQHIEEMGLDWDTDSRDNGDHLNYYGAKKTTEYLCKYIMENYELPNHKGDEKYQSWDDYYQEYLEYVEKEGTSGKTEEGEA